MQARAGAARHEATSTGRWARRCLPFVILLTLAISGFGCGPADVVWTFDNRTDEVLCEYPSPQGAAGARCLAELEPQAETDWGRDCDGKTSRPIPVIITVKQGGRQIYSETRSCGEWHDTDRTFVIEQEDGEFIVTAPDGAPGGVDR